MAEGLFLKLSLLALLVSLAGCGSGISVIGTGAVAPLGVAAGTPGTAQADGTQRATTAPTMSVTSGAETLAACMHCAP